MEARLRLKGVSPIVTDMLAVQCTYPMSNISAPHPNPLFYAEYDIRSKSHVLTNKTEILDLLPVQLSHTIPLSCF